MNKIALTLGIILIIISFAVIIIFKPAPIDKAVLYIESGTVEVNLGGGWVSAYNEMILKTSNDIRTGEDGKATIVFLEGELMHLVPNTQVKIDTITNSKIKIIQLSGETWNKITKISGIKEYQVLTPNTVATVRGTEFYLTDDEVEVAEGTVDFKDKKTAKKLRVGAGKLTDRKTMKLQELTEERKLRQENFRDKYVKVLDQVRAREIRKQKKVLRFSNSKKYSEQEVLTKLRAADEGKEDIEQAYKEIPKIMRGRAKRTYELTKQIQKAKRTPRMTGQQRSQMLLKLREKELNKEATKKLASKTSAPIVREKIEASVDKERVNKPIDITIKEVFKTDEKLVSDSALREKEVVNLETKETITQAPRVQVLSLRELQLVDIRKFKTNYPKAFEKIKTLLTEENLKRLNNANELELKKYKERIGTENVITLKIIIEQRKKR